MYAAPEGPPLVSPNIAGTPSSSLRPSISLRMFVAPKHRAKQMDAAGEWMMIKQRASGSPPTGDRVYLLYYRGRDADHC